MDEKINFKPHTTHMLAHKAESDVVRISYRNQRTLPMWLTVVPPTNHPNDTITHPYIYIHTLTLRQRIQPKLFALHNLLANGNNIMSHLCPKPPSLFNKKTMLMNESVLTIYTSDSLRWMFTATTFQIVHLTQKLNVNLKQLLYVWAMLSPQMFIGFRSRFCVDLLKFD